MFSPEDRNLLELIDPVAEAQGYAIVRVRLMGGSKSGRTLQIMAERPDGTRVQILGHGFRNSYEQAVTSFGDIFQNDNDDTPACRTAFLLEHGNAGFFSRDGRRTWQATRRGRSTWSRS